MARMPHPWYRRAKRMWYTTLNGKQTPLNVSDPKDEAAAWDALRALVSGAVKDAIAAPDPVRAGRVKELVAAFLEAKAADVKPRTLRGYGQHLGWLVKHWGDEPLAAVAAQGVRTKAAGEAWSDTHRANVFWTINALFRWGGRADRLPLPPKESRGADVVIPEAVHRRVVAETAGDFRQLVQFLWWTGCRPGEATGLTADAVAPDAKTIRIKQHKTRHKGKVRTLHLCAEAAQVVTDQLAKYGGAGHLFRGLKGRPFSLQAMTMRFERVSEKVGHKVTSYAYRHTFATRALAAGESDAVVAALLGHSSTAMIHKHYSHLSSQGRQLSDAAQRIARTG